MHVDPIARKIRRPLLDSVPLPGGLSEGIWHQSENVEASAAHLRARGNLRYDDERANLTAARGESMLECSHPLPDSQILAGRQGFLLACCAGKTVLHVGCVDSGLTAERLARGELLHQRLAGVATELWGTDVDAVGIRLLLDHGFDRVLPVDLSSGSPGPVLASVDFDLIVLGEVLEHLANPGQLLCGVRSLMRPGRTRLIVSVPNAFSLAALSSFLGGVEVVHPDHNFYFSRHTLQTLLGKSGLRVLEEYVYVFDVDYLPARRLRSTLFFDATGRVEVRDYRSSVRRLLGRLRACGLAQAFTEIARTAISAALYRRTPYWADGVVAVCARSDDGAPTP
jgi:2-polyprenyl-3-methyl-5-hydroxy-6-metoxy-1,4-benzoquinol methylase